MVAFSDMLGAIAGDIIGSVYEFKPIKQRHFTLLQDASAFTDDTVLTVAIAESLLTGKSYTAALKHWGRRYPAAGYGRNFHQWLMSRCSVAYESWGNGSAMRVSPIGWAFDSLEETLKQATQTAMPTHNHPEGIRGAQAVAGCVWLARQGSSPDEIRNWVEASIGYDLSATVDEIRQGYGFDVSCAGSVPQALQCYLEANTTEEAIRLAVSLGGDADTQAAIAGAVAEASWGLEESLEQAVLQRLPEDMLGIIARFREQFISPRLRRSGNGAQ